MARYPRGVRASRLLFLLAPAVLAAASCSRVPVFAIEGGSGGGGSASTGSTSTTTPSGSTTTTTSVTTTTSSSTTGTAPSCWNAGIGGWSSFTQIPLSSLQLSEAPNLHVSPDGLTAHFAGKPDAGATRQVPMVTTRASRASSFGAAQPVAGWPDTAPNVVDAWMALDGRELYVNAAASGASNALYVSTAASGGAWSGLTSLGSSINVDQILTGTFSLTGDGVSLFFVRLDGPVDPAFGQLWRLYTAHRAAPVTPGKPFTYNGNLQLPPVVDHEILMCPVISPDGSRLFFATSYPYLTTGATGGEDQALVVYGTELSGGTWAEATHLTALDGQHLETCPTSITADGCELYLKRFPFGAAPGTAELWVAHRAPQ